MKNLEMHLPFRTEKKLIGVRGASTCIFLRIIIIFFPHFADKELVFMQQL